MTKRERKDLRKKYAEISSKQSTQASGRVRNKLRNLSISPRMQLRLARVTVSIIFGLLFGWAAMNVIVLGLVGQLPNTGFNFFFPSVYSGLLDYLIWVVFSSIGAVFIYWTQWGQEKRH